MKLAKLLGMGSSFFGGGQTAAYSLNNRGWLPKFNEGRNPFAPKAAAEAPEAPKEKAAAPVAAPAPKAPAPSAFAAVAQPVKPQRAGVPIPIGSAPAQPASQPAAKPARPGWTTRLNPFRAPEPAAQPECAVQVELSLAAVKVVHNDLADADVEIVPVKARADAPAAAPDLSPARLAWEYMGENLLKST